jgi:hypothetical protein
VVCNIRYEEIRIFTSLISERYQAQHLFVRFLSRAYGKLVSMLQSSWADMPITIFPPFEGNSDSRSINRPSPTHYHYPFQPIHLRSSCLSLPEAVRLRRDHVSDGQEAVCGVRYTVECGVDYPSPSAAIRTRYKVSTAISATDISSLRTPQLRPPQSFQDD